MRERERKKGKERGGKTDRCQAEKDKYCMQLLICETKKKKIKLLETESRQVVARG